MRKMPKWLVIALVVWPAVALGFRLYHNDEAARIAIVLYVGFLLTMLHSGYTSNRNDDAS